MRRLVRLADDDNDADDDIDVDVVDDVDDDTDDVDDNTDDVDEDTDDVDEDDEEVDKTEGDWSYCEASDKRVEDESNKDRLEWLNRLSKVPAGCLTRLG